VGHHVCGHRAAMGWGGALALALVVCACSFDTAPAHGSAQGKPDIAQHAPETRAGSPAVPPIDMPVDVPPADPTPTVPVPGDPTPADAGIIGTDPPRVPPDPGVTPPVDAGMAPPTDPGAAGSGSNSLLDGLRDLLANNPRVAEANALRRIMAAISSFGTPDVPDAMDALGDVDCLRNAETCVAVCSWAVLNCEHCSGDPACVTNMQQNCRRSCN